MLSLKPNPKEMWRPNWTILAQHLGWTLCVYEHNLMMRSLDQNLGWTLCVYEHNLMMRSLAQNLGWTQPNDEISWQQEQCTCSDWIRGPQLQSFNNHSKTQIGKRKKEKGRQHSLQWHHFSLVAWKFYS